MIDQKDIEIAKLRGQVEALEKMIKTLAAMQPAQPTIVGMPYPVPELVPQPPWPFNPSDPTFGDLYRTTCCNGIPEEIVTFTTLTGICPPS